MTGDLTDHGDVGGNGTAPINQLCRAGGVLFALCDSTIPGKHEGLLAPETLDWLQGVLAEAEEPSSSASTTIRFG